MFVASYRNTMANARTKMRDDDGVVRFDVIEARRRRAQREKLEALARQEIIDRQKAEINALLEKARAAAARVNKDDDGEIERFQHSFSLIEARFLRLFRVTRSEIYADRRQPKVVFIRQAIMYWSCRLTRKSLPEIGRLMGGRDHTTVLHGRKIYIEKRAKMRRKLKIPA